MVTTTATPHVIERRKRNVAPETLFGLWPCRSFSHQRSRHVLRAGWNKDLQPNFGNHKRTVLNTNMSSNNLYGNCGAYIIFIFHSHLIVQYGKLISLSSYNCTKFMSKFIETVFNFLWLKHLTTMVYQPQANGSMKSTTGWYPWEYAIMWLPAARLGCFCLSSYMRVQISCQSLHTHDNLYIRIFKTIFRPNTLQLPISTTAKL